MFVNPRRIQKLGALIKPATLLKFHKTLVDRKYRLLFSSHYRRRKPGPKGPSAELIAAIIELKRRNPRFGCVRIAQQISHAFGVDIDKDVVRRVLAKHYRPGDSGTNGPSWLTFIAQTKDSLWSLDLFRCESIALRSHWVLVVMTCSPAASSVLASSVNASTASWYLGCSTTPSLASPYRNTSAPTTTRLFRVHRWRANLRVLEIEEIKSVPYTPVS
ncbi:MAG: helix-turn-helix domain-containing protein, partial [Vicinamibacterales bacterium]